VVGHRGKPLTLVVERVEPMRLLAFRWHPFAIDQSVDYSAEPMTLVEFTLQPTEDGTLSTISESGFDAIRLARRADAFEANDEGWSLMVQLVGSYLKQSPR
jgi:uncharacterized protein YndB with AHSA1/START domain